MEELKETVARHDENIKALFEGQKEIRALAKSTNRLALSVEKLAVQMTSHEERIDAIEDDSRNKSRTVWTSIVTGIISAALGAMSAFLLK